jgi:succinoglycan biosynthesis protein ExoO
LQGVERTCASAVFVADQPEDFAAGVLRLHGDVTARTKQAAAALEVARVHFSPDAAYGEFVTWLEIQTRKLSQLQRQSG